MQTEGSAETVAAARRRTADAAARIAADQRAARAEGAAARRAQRRGRGEEPGNRAGPPRARGEGDRAGADLEIQIRVPRQHVARAAHAAEQHPDPRAAARRQPGRQSDAEAGRVRPHDPQRRHRPAEPDQRHPRPVEDRVGHRVGRCRGDLLHQPGRHGRPAVPARGGKPQAVVRRADRSQARPQHDHRLEAAAAGAEEPAVERLQVHRAGRRQAQHLPRRRAAGAPSTRSSNDAPAGGRVRGHRTPASASRRRSSGSSSRRSSRPTPAPTANTAAPASAWRSAANCRTCWAARSSCAAPRDAAAPSRCILPLKLSRHRRARRGSHRPCRR